MKLPLSWLREWVDIPWDAAELSHRLTMLGLEVESIAPVAPTFGNVVVAQITSVAPHPQADRLRVCQVDDGSGGPLQIVCGAANARVGLKTALARIGAQLPAGLHIKPARLRGVESQGMLCSASELGLTAEGEGILELPADAPVGQDLRQLLNLDDLILEIGVTPNRGDAMSARGVARELAAASGQPLHAPAIPDAPVTGKAGFAVKLEAGSGVGRFASRVINGIDNQCATPTWLRERLLRSGLRPISPVVDVTNYVLLELGQPMHAYDLALLQGSLQVRRARADEPLRLLDGREIRLQSDVLGIADEAGLVGMAGVMGGERTAISAATRDVFLEVAWFAPAAIAGRARRLGLLTDASQRFERGVDPALQEEALQRATALILQIAGGQAGAVDVQQVPAELPQRAPVALRLQKLQRLLGAAPTPAEVKSYLQSLGMHVSGEGETLSVTPPSWRFDIGIEADLIEEVARLWGLDRIPETPVLARRHVTGGSDKLLPETALLQLLAARGFQEVITFGFVDPKLQQQLLGDVPVITLQNPIASDLAVMRASLWPGLIGVARQNLRRQQDRLRLFEVARRFVRSRGDAFQEQKMIAGLICGSRLPEQWGASLQPADFHDLKAEVEALLAISGPQRLLRIEAGGTSPALHPGRSATVRCDGRVIGQLGELHPRHVQALDFTYAPLLFELDYEALATPVPAGYRPFSPFPQIRRDISFTVDEGEPFSRIVERVSVAASTQLKELRVFDVYQGKGVETGRKSIALGLILQDLSRTLTDDDADRIVAAVLAELGSALNAKLRE